MKIEEYYQGFSEEQVKKYRDEVRQRWGEKTLEESEQRVLKMGKTKFHEVQTEGGVIFQAISDNMDKGFDSDFIQAQVGKWREWLENFHHYSIEAVAGLGGEYSRNPQFGAFFDKYDKDLAPFLTKAIEYYCAREKQLKPGSGRPA